MSLNERIKYAAMKARHSNLLLPWYKKWWGVTSIILGGLFFLFLSVCSIYVLVKVQNILSGKDGVMTDQQIQDYLKNIHGDNTNYYMGTTSPQVTIVEFGDFACPFSHQSASVVKDLTTKYKNNVKLVWRDYLRNEDSIDLAITARCAGEQGKFWEMHDLLFAQQDNLTTNDTDRPSKLASLANGLKLNMNKFTTCFNNRTYLDQIKKDYDDGNALKIIGTPTWFVNNHVISGALDKNTFETMIKGLVK
jgi:protein-disulfide isomerase